MGIFLSLAAAPILAQTQTTTTTSSSTGYLPTTKIIGMKVKTTQGEEVGEVKDVVLDRSTGCMAYTVLSTGATGTRVSEHTKTVAVPWSVYTVTPDARVLTVEVDREKIYSAPAFDYARIEEFSSPTYINNVYSYYGVSGQVGVSGESQRSFGAENRTNAQGSAGNVNANPGANPSPAATTAGSYSGYGAVPSPGVSPGAAVSSSPSASASPAASPSSKASREETRSGKTKPRHHETPAGQGTEEGTEAKSSRHHTTPEGAESAESSPSEHSRATKHRTRTQEEAEPSASPKGTPGE